MNATLDDQGAVTQRYTFGPYGNLEYAEGNSDNRYLFQGKELDLESGDYYFGARYYDAEAGRWTARDPKEQFLSSYVFCNNNPVTFLDPTGEQSKYHNNMSAYVQWKGQMEYQTMVVYKEYAIYLMEETAWMAGSEIGFGLLGRGAGTFLRFAKHGKNAPKVYKRYRNFKQYQKAQSLSNKSSQINKAVDGVKKQKEYEIIESEYHGNDRRNPNAQHNYVIINKDGGVRKTGVGTGDAPDDYSKRPLQNLKTS